MRTKTHVKAGGRTPNHNETLAVGMKARTGLKAGKNRK